MFPKDVIHHSLERCRGVLQAEGHSDKLVVSPIDTKSCFLDVLLINLDVVEPGGQIQSGEILAFAEFVQI